MTAFSVLAMSFFMNVIAVIFIICAVVLILTVLIQKGRGGGLGAAFGGMAGGILGSKTGDFLTWVTIALVGVFLALAVLMAKFYKPAISDSAVGRPRSTQQLPAQQQSSEFPSAPDGAAEHDETSDESVDINSFGG